MEENIALDKKFQKRFNKNVNAIKKVIKVSKDKNSKPEHGIVYVGHIPHGFYEKEMLAYFKQFGKVSALRLCRSKRTGRSRGYAFVEFADAEVAKISAETMNNYLMFNRRLIAKFIPNKSRLLHLGKNWSTDKYPRKNQREKENNIRNKNVNEKASKLKTMKMLVQMKKSVRKLHALGIEYSFQPVDVPSYLKIVDEKDTPQSIKKLKRVSDKNVEVKQSALKSQKTQRGQP